MAFFRKKDEDAVFKGIFMFRSSTLMHHAKTSSKKQTEKGNFAERRRREKEEKGKRGRCNKIESVILILGQFLP